MKGTGVLPVPCSVTMNSPLSAIFNAPDSRFAGSGGASRVLALVFNPAWLVVLAALALSFLGIHAIDLSESLQPAAQSLSPTAFKQLVLLGIGVSAALCIVFPDYRLLGALSLPFMLAVIVLLVFLLIPFVPDSIVKPRNGARSWINLGFMDFQPSELAKIAFVLTLAHYLRNKDHHRTVLGLVPPGLIAFVPVALITLQPDLGTSLLFVPALFAMLVAAGAKLKHLTLIVLLAATAAPLSYPILKPHQQRRIQGLLQQFRGDSSGDADINFQALTAQTLIGAGQMSGVSEAKARALVHYNRLPERHNDMIYAVLVNRYGLTGAAVLLGLYLLWITGSLLTAAATREPVGRLLIVGITAFIAAQVVVNIGMNVGLLPIIGITLPFVSYGGSSLVAVWLMAGLVVNVSLRRPRKPVRQQFEYADDE